MNDLTFQNIDLGKISLDKETVEVIKALCTIANMLPVFLISAAVVYKYVNSYILPAASSFGEKIVDIYASYNASKVIPSDPYIELVREVVMEGQELLGVDTSF